jgi:DNA-binding NtrC family response regulator
VTILVLEESPAVRELVDQALRDDGHGVLSTKDAREAVEVVGRVRVDLLVVGDVGDADKESLVHELRSIQPGMRVIHIGSSGSDDSTTLATPLALDELRAAAARR